MGTSLEFLVSKMGLITLFTQPVSVLRAKVWKVVMKYANVMLLNFWTLSLRMYIFAEVTFFLTYWNNQLSFSLSLCISFMFWWSIFFLEPVMISVSLIFYSFCSHHCIKTMHPIKPNYPCQTEKLYWKRLPKRCFFYPITKDLDPNNVIQTEQKFVSWILLPLVIYLG